MEKEQICELLIEDISSEGSGIGRAGGLVVFVDGALPGDGIRARFTKVKKNYALADLKSRKGILTILKRQPNNISRFLLLAMIDGIGPGILLSRTKAVVCIS